MKTYVKYLIGAAFALLVLLAGAFAPPIGPGNLEVCLKKVDNESTMVNVVVDNLRDKRTSITIVSVEGETWHRDFVWNEESYAASFDFVAVEPGDYIIYVANDREEVVMPIMVGDEEVDFINEPINRITSATEAKAASVYGEMIVRFRPAEGKAVNVHAANLNRQLTKVRMSRIDGLPVYREEVNYEGAYAKRFELEGIADGEYFMYIGTPEAVAFKYLKVKGDKVTLGRTTGKVRKPFATPAAEPVEVVTMN